MDPTEGFGNGSQVAMQRNYVLEWMVGRSKQLRNSTRGDSPRVIISERTFP
jgi:hypothetical protein